MMSWGGCSSQKTATSESPQSNTLNTSLPNHEIALTLGKELTNILFEPQQINAYVLTQPIDFKTDVTTFPRTAHRQLTTKQIDLLYTCLLNNELCYHNDSITLMSPYIPALEIVFSKDSCETSLVVSFSDHTWSIVQNNKPLFNFNYTTEEPLKNIYNSIDSTFHY